MRREVGSHEYGAKLRAGQRPVGVRALPRCPKCGLTQVPKSLAEGKMLEVEALLEDK